MTTYRLSLDGDEEKAANATHWATFRKATLVLPDAEHDGLVILEHGVTAPTPARAAPEALADLLVRTLDIRDGTRVVFADFDGDQFAADVVAGVAALGRDVRCSGPARDFVFSASVQAPRTTSR